MLKAKQNYAKKCKQKIVTFYMCDKDLYEYAQTINFQAFVKDALYRALNDDLISGKLTK